MGIGIGIGIGNSFFRRGGGVSWSSYWSSLISATVENAAPTHVVLTFPTAQTSLGASDFTIAGFTISSASWAGAVLTLVLSTAVVYGDTPVVTFVATGGTANVTNNVSFTDNFSRADGALENGWTYNGSWLISSNKLVAAPSVTGSNLVTNGDFETGDPPTGWNVTASNTIAQNADTRPGSAGSASALLTVGGSAYAANRQVTAPAGRFFKLTHWGKRGTATSLGYAWHGIEHYWDDADWIEHSIGLISINNIVSLNLLGASGTSYHDDIEIKQIVTNEIFATRNFGVADADISLKINFTDMDYAGVVLCVDNTTTPTDYITVGIQPNKATAATTNYYLYINKVVGGTYTNVQALQYQFYSGYDGTGVLKVKKYGSTIKVFMDGVQIGEDVFVTDAGLINNTIHGVFSTGDSAIFEDFEFSKNVTGVISGTPVFTRVAQATVWSTSGTNDWLGRTSLLNDGSKWLLTYCAGTDHTPNAAAQIVIRFSDDEGANWTNENTALASDGGGAITGFPINEHNALYPVGEGDLILCPNGDILCHAYEFWPGTYQHRSTDGGLTWTEESFLSGIVGNHNYFNVGTTMYAALSVFDGLGDWLIGLYSSVDNGVNWVKVGDIDADGNEHTVVRCPNGDFLCVSRDDDALTTYQYRSTDGGVTWSTKEARTELGILQRPRMKLDGANGIILFGREVKTSSLKYGMLWYSNDNGLTWGRKFNTDTVSYNDGNYGDYLIKTDGSYYMLDYRGTTAAAVIRRKTFTKA